eukprot:CAMPEP_0115583680 /NCGR_PEP_ID=MMETSP0272-20121206/6297_1 /TAXON_ID=71861 /ORGANISM="Scrippsiella trochoidea, Strain CCMP3099" /LENGTH=146 /DNA_ID=CAMNT_0003018699 /DNA_START=9 /DNA_END=450 /DNA_ORIENTATION=-
MSPMRLVALLAAFAFASVSPTTAYVESKMASALDSDDVCLQTSPSSPRCALNALQHGVPKAVEFTGNRKVNAADSATKAPTIHWDYYDACYWTSSYTKSDVQHSCAWGQKSIEVDLARARINTSPSSTRLLAAWAALRAADTATRS